jgi:glycosyltransferase 2 family protein
VVGVLIAAALLVWVLHDVRWSEVRDHVARADWGFLALAVLVATSTFLIRAVRWRLMLRGPDGAPLPLAPLWRAVAVGFMANNLLPARAGEFARAWIAGRQLPVRMSAALASIAVERAFDGLVITGLMALALASPAFPDDARIGGIALRGIATSLAILFAGLLVLAIVVATRPAPWIAALRRVSHALLPARFADRVITIAEGLIAGLAILRTPGRLPGVIGWSIVLWVVNGASFWLCFQAFHLAVPAEAAFLLQGLIAYGVAIPALPGFFGVFEAVAIVALGFYGVNKDLAVSYAVAYHVTTFVPITVLGLIALSRLHLRFGDLRAARAAERASQ